MSRTPDHAPAPATTPEYSTEERNVLSMDQIEQWRAYLKDDLSDRRSRSGYVPSLGVSLAPDTEPPYVTEFKDSINDSLEAYLVAQGVPTDSPRYTDIKGFFRDASIDKIPEDKWGVESPSPTDATDVKSPRERFSDAIDERLRTSAPETDDDEEEKRAERERKINEARQAVEEARERWASVSSKRQGMVFRRNAKNQVLARQEYNDKVNQLGRLELEDVIKDDAVSDADKNAAVIEYLFKEQGKLRELTTEKLKGTKVSKFINWFNKGGFVKRFLKGGAIGVVAGVGGTFLAGLAGAGIVAGGAVAATRFIRGAALGEKDKRGMDIAADSLKGEVASRLDETDGNDAFDKASIHMNAAFENDTRKEQNKRRKSALIGLGFIAVGEVVGYGAHAAVDVLSHHNLQMWHPFNNHTGRVVNNGDGPGSALPQSGSGVTPSLIDKLPPLPHVSGEYPWNRMENALSGGIITPPKGMGAEQALHYYSNLLSGNGDRVQWDPLSKGREYLVVNGNSDTDYVWNRILSAAQKAGDVAKR